MNLRGIVLIVLLALFASGCATSTQRYNRVGTAGAVTFLTGGASIILARQVVSVRHEKTAGVVTGIGATAQAVGLLMCIYALDGLISSGHPHVNERPHGFREDVQLRLPEAPTTQVPWSVRAH
ncbi:MAG: hypothetical protein ACJAYU_005277 [Bradymonadia bacterium]|jgi:hypothetical protein